MLIPDITSFLQRSFCDKIIQELERVGFDSLAREYPPDYRDSERSKYPIINYCTIVIIINLLLLINFQYYFLNFVNNVPSTYTTTKTCWLVMGFSEELFQTSSYSRCTPVWVWT